MSSIKRGVRRFILWSSVPPFVQLYRGCYHLIIQLVLLSLRGRRSIVAVYVGRGCARNAITPAISDIDLSIIVRNDSTEKAAIQRLFQAWKWATFGLVDYFPRLVATEEEVEARWRTSPVWRYRYSEARATWKLLAGTDFLATLPPMPEMHRRSGCYAEMVRWWLIWVREVFQPGSDPVLQRIACFKAVAELQNVREELRAGVFNGDRGSARPQGPLAASLERSLRSRRLAEDPGLADEALRFLLPFFAGLWRDFEADPYLQVIPGVTQRVVGTCETTTFEAAHLARLLAHLESAWGGKCRGAHAVRGAAWDADEMLCILDIDEATLPTVADIRGLLEAHRAAGKTSQRFHLFLRVGDMGLPLVPVIPRDWHLGLLSPASTPDVFLQLGEGSVYWTELTHWRLCDWRSNEQWSDASAAKLDQLEAIRVSAEAGEVTYLIGPIAPEPLAPS